jgi:acid phosphatase
LVVGVLAGATACGTKSGVVTTPARGAGTGVGAGAAQAANGVTAGGGAEVPNLYEVQQRVEDHIRSGRYDADVARVDAEATMWLEQRAKAVAKPAIVLDIDETSLSNWTAYRLNGWGRVVGGGCDLEQGPCGLRAWQALGQSTALAPTLALARRARELNVAVFFISGRPANLREATERNLREQGYEWTGVIILPEGAKFASAVDFKAPERRKLTEQGYTILLSLGDQESDLKGGYAERTFKLPNPVYFLP